MSHRLFRLLAVFTVTAALSACSANLLQSGSQGPAASPLVEAIAISVTCNPDGTVINPQTSFPKGVTDFCYAVKVNPTERTVVHTSVYAIATGIWNEEVLYAKDTTVDLADQITFNLKRNAGWPEGRYRVDVAVDGTTVASQEYSVQ